jgi:ABC-2 type transport system ATP-binding protein
MMKSGRIVDSGAPKALIAKYGRSSLEDVFLEVARHGAREANVP